MSPRWEHRGATTQAASTRLRSWRMGLWLAIVTVIAWALVGRGAPSGFPLDDAWIHQVVARNFASTGRPGFVPGTAAGGSTSLLWTLLLAPAHMVSGLDPVAYTRALSLFLWIATIEVLFALSRADGWSDAESAVVASGTAVCGNAVWFAWSGMEATLVIALSAGAVLAWRTDRDRHRDACLTALAFARPEGLGLTLLMGAVAPTWRARLRVVLVPCVAAAGIALWSWQVIGTPVPTTMAGRRWLYAIDEHGRVLNVTYFAVQWLYQLWRYLAVHSLLFALTIAWLAVLGAMAAWHRRAAGWFMLLAWTVATIVIYVPILPRMGHAGRYQPLVPVVLLPLCAMGLLWLGRVLVGRGATIVAAIAVLGMGAPSLMIWHTILLAGIEHIDGTHRAIGQWVRAHAPSNATVAAFDVGGLAWELPGRVVDLSALSDGNVEFLRNGRVADLVHERHATMVMLPMPPPGDTNGRTLFNLGPDRVNLRELQRRSTPEQVWSLGYWSTSHAWLGQILYEVVEDGRPATEIR